MSPSNPISVRVWGDYACFTRPEMKVERVSYPICTPSAARGILEAIFWEPQMCYVIDTISVIKKGRWFNFRRNEVTSIVSLRETKSWMTGKIPIKYIYASDPEERAQRNTLGLADIEYIITAEVRTTKLHDATRFNLQKYLKEIERRASKGKCYHRPAFGCREFAVDFEWVSDVKEVLEQRAFEVRADKDDKNWRQTWPEEDLGLMLYDVFDVSQRGDGFRWLTDDELKSALSEPGASAAAKPQRGKKKVVPQNRIKYSEGTSIAPRAAFFHARIKDSQMDCHPDRIKIIPEKRAEVT